jgi:hypothetical protein
MRYVYHSIFISINSNNIILLHKLNIKVNNKVPKENLPEKYHAAFWCYSGILGPLVIANLVIRTFYVSDLEAFSHVSFIIALRNYYY